VTEGGSKTYTVRLGMMPSGTVTVNLTRQSGSTDVSFSPASLTFNRSGNNLWSAPQTVTVSASQDGDQADETATIRHTASGGGYGSVSGDVAVAVTDDDRGGPTITLERHPEMPAGRVDEGTPVRFLLKTSELPKRGSLTVWLTVTEPAGADFAQVQRFGGVKRYRTSFFPAWSPGTNVWNNDKKVKEVWLRTADDATDEPSGDVTVTVDAGEDYHVGAQSSLTVEMWDDDLGANDQVPGYGRAPCLDCVWVTGGGAITEGQTAQFTLRAYPAPKKDLWVQVQVLDKPGGSAAHFFLSGSERRARQLRLPVGQSDVSFEVRTLDDATDEPDSYISAYAVRPVKQTPVYYRTLKDGPLRQHGHEWTFDSGSPYRARKDSARVTVRDNDDPPPPETVRPEVSFSQATSFVEEGGIIGLRVNVVPAPASPINIGYRVDDRSKARAGSDYTRPSGTVAVPAGTSAVEFFLSTLDDGNAEGSEDVVLRLSKGAGYRVKSGATDRHMLIIEDNDGGGLFSGTPTVFFGSWSSTVVENSGLPATEITVVPAPTSSLTVNLAMTDGSATAGSDYTNLTSVTVPAHQSVVELANIIDDSATEGDESFTIALQPGTGYRVYDAGISTTRRNRHTVTIVDDETDPAKYVSFSLSKSTIEEDAADPWVDVDIRLSEPHTPAAPGYLAPVLDFGVCFSGSARRSNSMSKTGANGYDYRVWMDGRILTGACPGGRFARGETHERMRIEILDDAHEDSGETIRVGMLRDDPEQWRSLGVLLRAPLQTLTVLNDEPTTLPAGHPVVKYGSLVKSFYARITAQHQHGDSPSGGWNKRFLKAMGHPEYVDYPQAAVTVADATRMWNHGGPGANTAWDGTVEAVTYAEQYFAGQTTTTPAADPEVTIAAGDDVTEGASATFTLTADPAPSAPLDVSVTVATDGEFGIAAGTQTVTIPTTGSATLTLATAGDEADEPDGSVSVTVDAGTGYTVGAASSGTVAIADDDLPPPVISVTAGAGVTEGGDAVFTVKADRAPAADLAVTLTVSEKAGSDFVAARRRPRSCPCPSQP